MRIGFIGAGKMAHGFLRGMLASGRFSPDALSASSPQDPCSRLDDIEKMGIMTTDDNLEVAQRSDVIFLAVKPLLVPKVAAEIAPSLTKDKLVVSIALGITLRSIESLLPSKARVVRVMPNSPVVVRAGASAYSIGSGCLQGDSDTVYDILSTVGYAVEVPESLVDPVTGLSGSGPSYMFCAIEALADGGVKVGIPRTLAVELACHTLLGAARMVLETGQHPAALKDDVQSPSGSSIYAMHRLERSAFRGLLMDAVEAACQRSADTGSAAQTAHYRSLDLSNGYLEHGYRNVHSRGDDVKQFDSAAGKF